MTEQTEQLDRVTSRIGRAILEFCGANPEFRAEELRHHVGLTCGSSAPASADRILRDLRRRKLVNYEVVDRRASLYRVLPVAMGQVEFRW